MIHVDSISVVICTLNRADKLGMALRSLQEMSVPEGVSWDVVVVDNNSTDNTRETVLAFAKDSQMPVKYVLEARPGLSLARNKGISVSHGRIIASIDDDCIVTRDWLVNILKEFQADRNLSVLGGRVELFDHRDQPITIRLMDHVIVVMSVSEIFFSIPGCNIAYTREAAESIGGFDPRFGPGTRIPGAEESDFLYRALKSGFKMVYFPGVKLFHNHGRRTQGEVRALKKGYAIGRGAFYCKYVLRGDMAVLREGYWELRKSLSDLFRRLVRGQNFLENVGSLWGLMLGTLYFVRASFALRMW